MKQFVISNRLIAVVVALILWLYVNVLISPTVQRVFDIPVRYNGLPERMLIDPETPRAKVTLSGLRRDFILANAADGLSVVTAEVDLYNARPGRDKVPVKIQALRGGLNVVKIEPPEIEILVTPLERRVMEVTPMIQGPAGEGYLEDPPVLGTRTVVLEAPAEILDKVAMCQVDADIRGIDHSYSEMRTVVVVGRNGNPVPNVTVTPAKINVAVSIKKGWPTKLLPVKVARINNPAEGYRLVDCTATPETVLVEGPGRVIENLQFIETTELDVARVKRTATLTRTLVLPYENLRFIDANSVKVTVLVEEVPIERLLADLPLEVATGRNLTATTSPLRVSLRVRGLPSLLGQLASMTIALRIDAHKLDAGQHLLAPALPRANSLPRGVEALAVVPATVTVTLAPPGETPTPTPTPPPAPPQPDLASPAHVNPTPPPEGH